MKLTRFPSLEYQFRPQENGLGRSVRVWVVSSDEEGSKSRFSFNGVNWPALPLSHMRPRLL